MILAKKNPGQQAVLVQMGHHIGGQRFNLCLTNMSPSKYMDSTSVPCKVLRTVAWRGHMGSSHNPATKPLEGTMVPAPVLRESLQPHMPGTEDRLTPGESESASSLLFPIHLSCRFLPRVQQGWLSLWEKKVPCGLGSCFYLWEKTNYLVLLVASGARESLLTMWGAANGTAILCRSVISSSRHFHPSPRKNNDS